MVKRRATPSLSEHQLCGSTSLAVTRWSMALVAPTDRPALKRSHQPRDTCCDRHVYCLLGGLYSACRRGLDLVQVEVHVITTPVPRLDRDPDRRLLETAKRLWLRLLVRTPWCDLTASTRTTPVKWPSCRRIVGRYSGGLTVCPAGASHSKERGGESRGWPGIGPPAISMPSAIQTSISGEPGDTLVLSSEHRAAPASAPVDPEPVATDVERTYLAVIAEASGMQTESSGVGGARDGGVLGAGVALTRAKLRDL